MFRQACCVPANSNSEFGKLDTLKNVDWQAMEEQVLYVPDNGRKCFIFPHGGKFVPLRLLPQLRFFYILDVPQLPTTNTSIILSNTNGSRKAVSHPATIYWYGSGFQCYSMQVQKLTYFDARHLILKQMTWRVNWNPCLVATFILVWHSCQIQLSVVLDLRFYRGKGYQFYSS